MWIERLHLAAAPGLLDGLPELSLRPGINVVLGPNASGKSTLARAARFCFWPDEAPAALDARLVLSLAEEKRVARLVHGRVRWDPSSPPLPGVQSARLYALGMRALLSATDDDGEIARRIAVELFGGVDLEGAIERFPARPSPSRPQRASLKGARDKLRQIEQRMAGLSASESRLEAARAQLSEAREAKGALDEARRLLEHVQTREKARAARAALAALPSGLDAIVGDEPARIDELEADLGRLVEARAQLQRELDRVEEELGSLGLPQDPPSDEVIAAARERLEKVDEVRRTEAQERLAAQAARAKAEELKARLLVAEEVDLAPEDVEALERLLHERRRRRAEVEARRARTQEVGARLPSSGEPPSVEALRERARLFRSWLRAKGGARKERSAGWAWVLVVVLGALLAAGLAFVHPLAASAGALLAGVGLGYGLARRRGARGDAGGGLTRAHWEEEAKRAGHALPRWTEEEVERRLREVEEEITRAEEARAAFEAHRAAEDALSVATKSCEEIEAELQSFLEQRGLAPTLAELSLLEQAHRLLALRAAEVERRGAEARLEEARKQREEATAALEVSLLRLGLKGCDVAEARAALTSLKERRRRHQELSAKKRELSRRLAENDEERRRVEEKIRALFERAGATPKDQGALEARMRLWEEQKQRAEEVRVLERRLEELSAAREESAFLRARGIDPDRISEAEARALVEELSERAERLEDDAAAVRDLEKDLEAARAGHDLEDALAEVSLREDEVDRARREAQASALARWLLEDVRREAQEEEAPRLLERARAWFGRFTHHAFRLEVDLAKSRFVALEVSRGARRELEELSDATRIQLLLAARLAAIEEGEGGGPPLPLFLDEVLSTTDEMRFVEVGRALFELSSAGRQVIYLCADSAEAEAWRALSERAGAPKPHIVDLAALRAGRGARREPIRFVPPAPPRVPPPEGDVEAWAQRLGIGPPDPTAPASAWHLLYVLYDRADVVHACLLERIETLGAFFEAAKNRALPDAAREVEALARARAVLLEAVLKGLAVGRGRPIAWDDVVQSGAVTPAFEERLREALDEAGEDARRFLALVDEIPRFRAATKERLKEHFLAIGALSEAEPLALEEVALRAMGTLGQHLSTSALDRADARAFIDHVLALFRPGVARAS